MLCSGAGKGLVVLEALYMLKLRADSWHTFNEIFRLLNDNFATSYQLTYQGLKSPLIFQRRKSPGIAGRRGRRAYLYRIPHPDEIKAEYGSGLPHSPTDTLQKADLQSLTSYRLALHRELFIRRFIDNRGRGFDMSRKLMAERLGVSTRTVRSYDKRLDFSHTPNHRETPVDWTNWHTLPRYKNQYDSDGRRLASKKWLKVYRYTDNSVRLLPLVRYLAYQALSKDCQVYTVERLPNTYYPYQRADLSGFSGDDVVSCYLADLEAKNSAGFYQAKDGGWFYQRE